MQIDKLLENNCILAKKIKFRVMNIVIIILIIIFIFVVIYRNSHKNTISLKMGNTGTFDVTGISYLPKETLKFLKKNLKPDIKVKLKADPKNKYDDKAVKVMIGNMQIGWVAADNYDKEKIFNTLINNKKIDAVISKIEWSENIKGKYINRIVVSFNRIDLL